MKKKHIYIPCELKVVEFDVERGFASSMIGEKQKNANKFIDFYILKNKPSDPEGIRNQQYKSTWGSGSDLW